MEKTMDKTMDKNRHLITVIIPTYNRKELLEKAMLSVLNQKNDKNFLLEIIIVDDGSTDGTKEYIRKYLDKYPEIIQYYYKENGGVGSARNIGISKTNKNSDYIIFLDSDDEIGEGILEKYINKREDLKKRGMYEQILFIDSFAIDQNGKLVGSKDFLNNKPETLWTPEDMLSIKINFESGGISKSSLFLDNPDFRYPEDIVTESVLGFKIVKYMIDHGLTALRIDEIGRMYRRDTGNQITKTISKKRFKNNAIGNDRILEIIGKELLERGFNEQYSEYIFRSGINRLLYGDHEKGLHRLKEAKDHYNSLRNSVLYTLGLIFPELILLIYKIFIQYEDLLRKHSFTKQQKYIIVNTFSHDKTVAPTLRFSILNKYIINKGHSCSIIGPKKNRGLLLNHLITVGKLILFLCKNIKNKNTIIFRDILLSPFLFVLKFIFGLEIFNEFHGYYNIELKNQGKNSLSYIAYPFDTLSTYMADKILSVSMGLNESQISNYKGKTLLLPNGIDKTELKSIITNNKLDIGLQEIVKKDLNQTKIGFAGNAAEWFDLEQVIDEVGPEKGISFYIIGKGYNFDHLKSKVKNNKYRNIHFIGNLSNVQTILLLNQMTLLIAPYSFEFPFSTIKYFFSSKKNKEYVFLKKPILMADIEGIDYIFRNKTGICTYSKTKGDLLKNIKHLESKEFYQQKTKELSELDNQIDFYDILDTSGLF